MVDLSICILTRIQDELLERCVASCLREIERTRLEAEIIVIDNGSANGAPQRVAQLSPMIQVLRNEENLGFSTANNAAIRMSRGHYVLILNDDTELHAEALSLMMKALDSIPQLAAVGPKLLNPDGSLQRGVTPKRFPHLIGVAFELLKLDRILERIPLTRDLLTLRQDIKHTGEAEHISGACILIRRSALDAAGLFDEGFYFYYEDADLCFRLKTTGWKLLYLAEAQATHHKSASFEKIVRSERNVIFHKSLIHYFKKHATPWRYTLFSITLALTLCLRIPFAMLLSVIPSARSRQKWKGSLQAHIGVLRLLLSP